MRPVNTERRAALADAAIEVLAGAGIRALTHRAVDAAAKEPDGTASRYFRTREAMLVAVADRVKELRLKALDEIGADGLDREGLADALVAGIRKAVTVDRAPQLAMVALFLESTHRPVLRDELAQIARAIQQTLERLCKQAGIELTPDESWALLTFFNGSVFLGLTLEPAADSTVRAGAIRLLGPAERG
jgi:DNA-binding transcriptional regulator YbjK